MVIAPHCGGVAQLVRALPCHGRGCGFEPRRSRHLLGELTFHGRRMRVCLDIQPALAQRAGVGRYTRMLGEHLAPLRGDDQLAFFYFDFKRKGCDFLPAGAESRAVRWLPGRFAQNLWKRINFPPYHWFSGPADVYHFPNFIRPPLTQGKSVVTIHDTAFLRLPETIEEKNYRYLSSCIRPTLERADAVICVSAFTARELEELLHVPASKLRVIHSGLDPAHQRATPQKIQHTRERLGLNRPYLLTVGTLEPRKNYPFLIELFEQLNFDGDLVIAGGQGWKTGPITEKLRASPRAGHIHVLNYVYEDDLAALYSGAELFVMTSLYEGFGFPPLEAMQCGTPVVAAATGSLPEVLGEAALLIQGFDLDAWRTAVTRLLETPSLCKQYSARGVAQAARYAWPVTARQTWEVYRSLVA
jgi:glycosyltransferase involved in cell wall biosynthesis